MNAALLLIDLQNDYLAAPRLSPAADAVVHRAATLLKHCRSRRGTTVIHIWTTVDPEGATAMPHWAGRLRCVEGTPGHQTPEALRPLDTERIVHKTFYSAFQNGALDEQLRSCGVDTVILAGVHLHACVRTTALDAYARGYRVVVADDAVASDDPMHAAITRRYLAARGIRFTSSDALDAQVSEASVNSATGPAADVLPAGSGESDTTSGELPVIAHVSPRAYQEIVWHVPVCGAREVAVAAEAGRRAAADWGRSSAETRSGLLERVADAVHAASEPLARRMVTDVGKPITEARAEVARSVELLHAAAQQARASKTSGGGHAGGVHVRRPLGLVGAITPWNNPLAIPIGKIAAAIAYGNAVLWKPAIPGSAIALDMMSILKSAELPDGLVNVVCGDRTTAVAVMEDERVSAVALSGSSEAGYSAHEICARRRVPFQAELGGNNAAIVWSDTDLEHAASCVTRGAFGFSGQRCTANRRVIVETGVYDDMLEHLRQQTASLVWGDPVSNATQVGPVISRAKREAVRALLERAHPAARMVFTHESPTSIDDELESGAYHPPTVVACDDPRHEIVQEETFGPVLVVQRATSWEHALALCNGVRQGLVAALFSRATERRADFLANAEAGILKIDQATGGAGTELPFGGWKESGVGPPEHGPANREFYTRAQALYGV